MIARALYQAIDIAKVKLALDRLDGLPCDGHQDRVKIVADQQWPFPTEMDKVAGAAVLDLAAQHQKGFAIHD